MNPGLSGQEEEGKRAEAQPAQVNRLGTGLLSDFSLLWVTSTRYHCATKREMTILVSHLIGPASNRTWPPPHYPTVSGPSKAFLEKCFLVFSVASQPHPRPPH